MSPPATWAGWSDRCGQVAASPPCMPATDWNPAGRAVHMVLQDQVPSTKGVYYQYQELASTQACVPEPSDTGLQEGKETMGFSLSPAQVALHLPRGARPRILFHRCTDLLVYPPMLQWAPFLIKLKDTASVTQASSPSPLVLSSLVPDSSPLRTEE